MKTINGKSYHDLSLYFRPENQNEKDAFDFLSLLGRRKTAFVSELIVQYLKSKGITNVATLPPEFAKWLISDSFVVKPVETTTSLQMEPILKLLEEQMKNQNPVIQISSSSQEYMEEPIKKKQSKSSIAKEKPGKKEDIKPQETTSDESLDIIIENDNDETDFEDDFVMDSDIMQGLSAFGIRTS